MLLVIAFVTGAIILMALAENPKLEDLTEKELINLMADESRQGWHGHRNRRYTRWMK